MAPFIQPSDITVKDYLIGKSFTLQVNGYDDIECEYLPTYGYEGFGRNKRRVTYPCGALRFKGGQKGYTSLDEMKLALCRELNSEK